jgi:D-methionine transport system ATP-binding protein
MITHEMQIVKDICNRVAVMQNGVLIEEGSVLDIFSNPREALTQDFIKVATGIEEALVKINKQDIVENLHDNALLVELKYTGHATDEPILNQIYKHYEVTANILYGNIEILDGVPVGELIVVLEGEQDKLAASLQALRDAEVSVVILKGGQA